MGKSNLCIAALMLLAFVQPDVRLLVIGDSITRGLYASQEQSAYKYLLADMMGAELESAEGYTLPGSIVMWEALEWKPDIVVVEVGLNDLCRDCGWYMGDEEWELLYGAFLGELKASGVEVVACTMFAMIPPGDERHDQYVIRNDIIRRQAAIHGVRLADLAQVTEGCLECLSDPAQVSTYPPLYHGDSKHPSDYGHQMIARTIYKALHHDIYIPLISYFTGAPAYRP